MNDYQKITFLKKKLEDLERFNKLLKEENLNGFESLKSEIRNLLSENQKIRFNQIEFYSVVNSSNNSSENDLPF